MTGDDVRGMLNDLRGHTVPDGVRGQPPVDRAAICDARRKLSDLMLSRPDIASIDINPAIAYPHGLLAVDARVLVYSAR